MQFGELLLEQGRNLLSVFVGALGLTGALLAVLCLAYKRLNWATARLATALVALAHAALAFWWCHSFTVEPFGDQMQVWSIATDFANGSAVASIDYLSKFPYQGRMALCMSFFIRIFGAKPMVWAMVGVVCCAVCVLALCGICGQISGSPAAQTACALLCLPFLPAPLYSSFIYGTTGSMALAFLGCYGVVRLCKGGRFWWWLVPLAAFPLSANLYSQGLIFAIAACLALVFTALYRWHKGKALLAQALLAVAMVAVTVYSGAVLQNTGLELANLPSESGIPYSATIMMGIHSNKDTGPGGYDASHYELYGEYDMDAAATDTAAKALIVQYLGEFAQDPGYAAWFFSTKTIRQWADPWFESLVMNNPGVTNNQGPLARAMVGGALFGPVRCLLGALLTVMYLAAAVGLVHIYRSDRSAVYKLLPAICFLGGFLFQLFWESQSRYCMPYFYMLAPLAGVGLATAAGWLAQKIPAQKQRFAAQS